MNESKNRFQIIKGLGGAGQSNKHYIALRSGRSDKGKILFIDSTMKDAEVDTNRSLDSVILFTKKGEDE